MKLYKISQDVNYNRDTYDSAIVAAESEDDARNTHPSGDNNDWMYDDMWTRESKKNCISVEYIGETELERGVVLASFNVG